MARGEYDVSEVRLTKTMHGWGRLTAFFVAAYYLIAPLPHVTGQLGHDLYHHMRGDTAHHQHPASHDPHASRDHGSADHSHDLPGLDTLLALDTSTSAEEASENAPVQGWDHLLPTGPCLSFLDPGDPLDQNLSGGSSPRERAPLLPPPRVC